MVRTRAILLSLCLCTLLASCGGNRHRGMEPAPRTSALEQAHGKADRQLALTAQALVEAQVATQAAQIEMDFARAAVATQVAGLETGMQLAALDVLWLSGESLLAEGYWPWFEEARIAGIMSGLRQGAKQARSALAAVVERAARQAQKAQGTAWYSAEVAKESVKIIQGLARTFQTDTLRAALADAAAVREKARKAVANAELVTRGAADVTDSAARLGTELDTLPFAGKAERHHARARTIAGRIAALATQTNPDEFPYSHAIPLYRHPSFWEDLTDLPTWDVPHLAVGSQWGVWAWKTPASERLIVYSHADHLHFGWWFTAPDDPAGIHFDTFTSGEYPFLAGNVEALTGTATYVGPAAGVYVERSAGSGSAETGVFTAAVTLTANFGASGTIGGAVSDFVTDIVVPRDDTVPSGAWTVELMRASLATETGDFKNTIGGAANGRAWEDGHWTGGFFGESHTTAAGNGFPAAVLGEFHAVRGTPQVEDGDAGFIGLSGVFGAHGPYPDEFFQRGQYDDKG